MGEGTGTELASQMPMLTLLPSGTDEPAGGSSVTTVPKADGSQLVVVVGAVASPWFCKMPAAAARLSPVTSGTDTSDGDALHTSMVTVVPLVTDVPPRGSWLTTLPLFVVSQLLVAVGAAVRPAPCRAVVA